MAMRELRIREVLIRQHRAPDDTSHHSEKHLLIAPFGLTGCHWEVGRCYEVVIVMVRLNSIRPRRETLLIAGRQSNGLYLVKSVRLSGPG
uniref:Uncharacterized protein n=1 Tax=Strigamia maritima TaxID=126957 RepID=T1IZV0_STRMM